MNEEFSGEEGDRQDHEWQEHDGIEGEHGSVREGEPGQKSGREGSEDHSTDPIPSCDEVSDQREECDGAQPPEKWIAQRKDLL